MKLALARTLSFVLALFCGLATPSVAQPYTPPRLISDLLIYLPTNTLGTVRAVDVRNYLTELVHSTVNLTSIVATAPAHNFVTGFSALGVPAFGQPAVADIAGLGPWTAIDTTNASNITSGALNGARLSPPTAVVLGGVLSATAPTNQFQTGIDLTGAPTFAQPTFSNLPDVATLAQLPLGAANSVLMGLGASPPAYAPVVDCQGASQAVQFHVGVWSCATISGGSGGTVASPTGTIGLTTVPGTATSASRSDSAPLLSQAIVPTWTGKHTFNGGVAVPSAFSQSGAYGYLGQFSTAAAYPAVNSPAGLVGLAVGWNFSSGDGETDLWNTYTASAGTQFGGFTLKQLNSASTSTDLMRLHANGLVRLPAYKSGTIVSDASGNLAAQSCVAIESYGGVADGATDNLAALTNAVAASAAATPNHMCVTFGSGRYVFSAQFAYTIPVPGGTSSFFMVGRGMDVTELFWSGGGGIALTTTTSGTTVHIRDMTLSTATTAGAGTTGLSIIRSPATGTPNTILSDITNVAFRGGNGYYTAQSWGTALNLNTFADVNIDGCVFAGSATTSVGLGIRLAGVAAVPGTVYNITNSQIYYYQIGMQILGYVQGISITNLNTLGVVTSIFVPSGLDATGLGQLLVSGSQISSATTSPGVLIQSSFESVGFVGDYFLIGNGGIGVDMAVMGSFFFNSNFVYAFGGSSNCIVVGANGGAGSYAGRGMISGNVIQGCGAGINLQTTSSGVNVQSNVYSNNGTAVVNSAGASNTVGGGSQ